MDAAIKTLKIPSTIYLAVGLMAILVMMVLPVPPFLLDVGLMLSFAFAILIFTVVLFVERPLDFSSFPAILLVSLLLRLSLNISSTKLIIGEGHTGPDAAGGVIEGFAMFIMGGNLAMGLIVFCVLIIVNFLVITKGAGRMAEVGARFALDAMPGKQLAIDADVAAGAISHEEAKKLRAREQEETAFLGSLDGVSKFVKGDAVAGLLVTLLNLIAGIAIGLFVHRISFGDAVQNYSILTVGDGLVNQIPAVIISVAAALLLSKGRSEGAVDTALVRELCSKPEALGAVGIAMVIFGAFPGLPILPFWMGALVLFGLAWRAYRLPPPEDETAPAGMVADESNEKDDEPCFGDLLDVDEIHVELSPKLVRTVIEGDGGFDARVKKIRRYVIQEYGFIMPPVRVTDRTSLADGVYEIRSHGVVVAENTLRAGEFLALIPDTEYEDIKGHSVREPVYGAAARWVSPRGKERLILDGVTVVDPVEVLSTHLLESVQSQFPRLMTRRALRTILDAFTKPSDPQRAESNKRFIEEMVPDKVPHDMLQQVLRDLLSERVSIRNLDLIIEAAAEGRASELSFDEIVEHVRRRLSLHFVTKLRDDRGQVPAVDLSDRWRDAFAAQDASADGPPAVPFDTTAFVTAARQAIDAAAAEGHFPVVAVHAHHRRAVRRILFAHGLKNSVVSFDELTVHGLPDIVGTI